MNEVNKTLYIPLYGKALVSRRGIILHDPKAEEIWDKEAFPLRGKARSKWLALYIGMRSAVFDRWLQKKIDSHPDAMILHIGCGMDSRSLRIGKKQSVWFDIDFPDVIEQRKLHYKESESYRMLGADVRQPQWLDQLPCKQEAIVIMEGISMYLEREELLALLSSVCSRFRNVSLLMDCYTEFAAKASKFKNPINEVGVTTVYGIDDPLVIEKSGLTFLSELSLTPQYLIDQLHGAEKIVFQHLYAGKLANKLYRLYEFESNNRNFKKEET